MKMYKIATSKFQNFGLRRDWLIFFLHNTEDWILKTNLGNRQVESLKIWLRESELLNGDKPTVVADILSKIVNRDELFVWEIVWTNLYHNENLIKWYLNSFDWGSSFSRKDLLERLLKDDRNAKERTAKNAISSLLNLFDSSPIGYELKIGIVEKRGKERYVKKIGSNDIHPFTVVYSLYKAAEHIGRRDLTVSELYSKEFEGGPYKLFGISKNKLIKVLKIFQKYKEPVLEVDISSNLENIYLREDISSLDILKFKLYRDTLSKEKNDHPYTFALPSKEIEIEKKKLRSKYRTIDKILDNKQKESLEILLRLEVNREIELIIMDASLIRDLLKRKIDKIFKKDYTIHICLLLGRNKMEINRIKNLLRELSNRDFEDIIFIVSEAVLDDIAFERFIEYKAKATVAHRYNWDREKKMYEKFTKEVINNWLNNVKSGYVQWFLQGRTGKELMYHLSKKIKEVLSREIFTYGLDNIEMIQKNRNVWRYRKSIKSIEIFLFAKNRKEIEEKTPDHLYRYLREILKDNYGEYIVDRNLRIKENAPEDHPLKKMYFEIKRALEKEKNKGVFNLGDALKFLTRPPYGVYSNMIYMGAIGFIMREYMGKLFEAESGRPIQKELMRDKILYLFEYWERGKYREELDVYFKTDDKENVEDWYAEKTIKDIENQIIRCHPEKLQEILIQIIKEYPEVRKIIKKHLV